MGEAPGAVDGDGVGAMAEARAVVHRIVFVGQHHGRLHRAGRGDRLRRLHPVGAVVGPGQRGIAVRRRALQAQRVGPLDLTHVQIVLERRRAAVGVGHQLFEQRWRLQSKDNAEPVGPAMPHHDRHRPFETINQSVSEEAFEDKLTVSVQAILTTEQSFIANVGAGARRKLKDRNQES